MEQSSEQEGLLVAREVIEDKTAAEQMIDIINVLNLIIKAMVIIEKMVTLDGESKKNAFKNNFVLTNLVKKISFKRFVNSASIHNSKLI